MRRPGSLPGLFAVGLSLLLLGAAPAGKERPYGDLPAQPEPSGFEAPAEEAAPTEEAPDTEAAYGAAFAPEETSEEPTETAPSAAPAQEEAPAGREAAYGGLGGAAGFAVLVGAGAYTAFRVKRRETQAPTPSPVYYRNFSEEARRREKDFLP